MIRPLAFALAASLTLALPAFAQRSASKPVTTTSRAATSSSKSTASISLPNTTSSTDAGSNDSSSASRLTPKGNAEVIDGIAATVNGAIITYSQVRGLVGPRERLLRQQFTGPELQQKLKEVRDSALQDLIDRELIVQKFHEDKLDLPQYFVDQRVNEIIRDSFGGDRQAFMKTLAAQNYSLSQFRQEEFNRIIVAAMRGKNVKPNTAASPLRVEDYYRKHREEFTSKEELHLRMIMVPSHSIDGNAASQKALAEEILSKLANGADFERMAQMYSEDTSRDTGGDWGWIARKTLAPELEKVAFNLPTKKMSRIVELGGNYYILRVDEKRGGVTKSLAEVRDDVEKKVLDEEAHRLQENWLAGLRQKATIRRF
ncbi:MAG: peptidylprolyl isomerase [Verrucomicrobiota bacterium]|nr:peptidylprolyl isomerase [Verrucomicrobiota bacterium]